MQETATAGTNPGNDARSSDLPLEPPVDFASLAGAVCGMAGDAIQRWRVLWSCHCRLLSALQLLQAIGRLGTTTTIILHTPSAGPLLTAGRISVLVQALAPIATRYAFAPADPGRSKRTTAKR